ncbi:MAG: hypothetical protein M1826_002895 [Phylliscum demangeonii]|nr:MAG: hypothetical protein M1826_002895 [Phylliscum demangeonii]
MSSSAPCPVQLILGLLAVGDASDPQAKYTTPAQAQEFVDIFRTRGYTQLDTARSYSPAAPGSSEAILGQTDVGHWATIDTKVMSRAPHSHRRATLLQSVRDSLEALHVAKAGHFTHFGLSNYTAQEVDEIVALCQKHGWVKPSVYQGQYSAVVRGGERDLFPVLRKHQIAFYAWSPTAGGFFTAKVSRTMEKEAGTRWDPATRVGQMFSGLFMHDALWSAAERVKAAAHEVGLTGHAAALRWVIHHSRLRPELGDGVVLGASSCQQLRENIDIAEAGPLPDHLVQVIDGLWPLVKDDAPSYHF